MNIYTSAAIGATALVLTGSLLSPAAAEPSAGVCAGVKRCHRVTKTDFDGDGRKDAIGWRQATKNRVVIRVRRARGRLLKRRVNVRYWSPGVWGGASRINGRRGTELLIGAQLGAHTPHYIMLTFRNGRIAVERSPYGSHPYNRRWTIDSALRYYQGWHRKVWPSGRVTMTMKDAWGRNHGRGFRGHNTRYEWRSGRWVQVRRVVKTYPNKRRAARIAGWHAGRLNRFPGTGR